MKRSAICIPALAILMAFAAPAPAMAQAQDGYTVEVGNTLWDLAERFMGDPFQWRQIWEANRSTIDNPDLIYPGQVIRIPTGDGTFVEVTVVPAGQGSGNPPPPPVMPPAQERERTIFYPDTTSNVEETRRAQEARFVAVPEQINRAAPFLVANSDLAPVGEVIAFAGEDRLRSGQVTAAPFDRLSVQTVGQAQMGGRYMTFRRVLREGLGEIAVPTALVTVVGVYDDEVHVSVDVVLDRATVGDELAPLPEYSAMPGLIPEAASGGPRVRVVGYEYPATVHGPGDHVFLDGGADVGMAVGDEYTVVWNETGQATSGVAQVVRVDARGATARIVRMRNTVFRADVQLVESRRMPRR